MNFPDFQSYFTNMFLKAFVQHIGVL